MTAREEIITGILRSEIPDIIGIYLFGSQVDNTSRDDSDYDFAFLTSRPEQFDPVYLFDLSNKLATTLSADVDLIDLYAVSLDLRFEIVTKGARIYCDDKTACDTFDMITISMYQRFEEERKPLIEAFKKRHTAHG